MFLLLCFLCFITYFIYSWFTIKPKNFPPGPPVYPIIGSLYVASDRYLYKSMHEWKEKYGPIIGLVLPQTYFYYISDPKLLMDCFNKDEFQGRITSLTFLDIIKAKGLFLNEGIDWQQLRRFTLKNLRDFGFNKETVIEDEFYKWKDFKMSQGNIHKVDNLFSNSAANIIWETISKKRKDYDDPEFNKFIKHFYVVMRAGGTFGFLSDLFPWFKQIMPKLTGYDDIKRRLNYCTDFIRREMKEHEQNLDLNEPKDIIDSSLIEIKNGNFTENQIMAIMIDLLLGGAESINSTISFALLYMILYPEVQKKVQNEIDVVIGQNQVSMVDRSRLPFVEATLTEAKRMNPIAPTGVPRKVQNDFLFEGYHFKKDSIIVFNLWSIFQDETVFKEPQKFRPERFIDSNGDFIRDERLVFFGSGRRRCVGESLARKMEFIYFVKVMQEFNVSLPDGDPTPSTKAKPGFTYAPQSFRIQFTKRI